MVLENCLVLLFFLPFSIYMYLDEQRWVIYGQFVDFKWQRRTEEGYSGRE